MKTLYYLPLLALFCLTSCGGANYDLGDLNLGDISSYAQLGIQISSSSPVKARKGIKNANDTGTYKANIAGVSNTQTVTTLNPKNDKEEELTLNLLYAYSFNNLYFLDYAENASYSMDKIPYTTPGAYYLLSKKTGKLYSIKKYNDPVDDGDLTSLHRLCNGYRHEDRFEFVPVANSDYSFYNGADSRFLFKENEKNLETIAYPLDPLSGVYSMQFVDKNGNLLLKRGHYEDIGNFYNYSPKDGVSIIENATEFIYGYDNVPYLKINGEYHKYEFSSTGYGPVVTMPYSGQDVNNYQTRKTESQYGLFVYPKGWLSKKYLEKTYYYPFRFVKNKHVYTSHFKDEKGNVLDEKYTLANDQDDVYIFDNKNDLYHCTAKDNPTLESDIAYFTCKKVFSDYVIDNVSNDPFGNIRFTGVDSSLRKVDGYINDKGVYADSISEKPTAYIQYLEPIK